MKSTDRTCSSQRVAYGLWSFSGCMKEISLLCPFLMRMRSVHIKDTRHHRRRLRVKWMMSRTDVYPFFLISSVHAFDSLSHFSNSLSTACFVFPGFGFLPLQSLLLLVQHVLFKKFEGFCFPIRDLSVLR